jgi:DHA2 family methylenomycin A resistance protein-like MFS transporter
MLAVGLLVGVAFWTIEHRIPVPMLPPVFFANRSRTVAVLCAALMGFLFYGTLFMMSLYFQEVRGWSPASAGIALLPLTVGTLAGPFVLYRPLARRFGHPRLLVAGFVGAGVGIAILSGTVRRTNYDLIALGLVMLGLASTVSFSALTSLLLSTVSSDHAGLASGVQNTTRQTGALMAVSILGAALNAHAIGTRLAVAFGVLAAASVVAVIVSSLSLIPAAGAQFKPVEQPGGEPR